MKILFKNFAVLGLVLTVTACATVNKASSWRDPDFTGPGFKNVLVVVASHGQTDRRVVEDSIVNSLLADGVAGVSSYTQVSDLSSTDAAQLQALPSIQSTAQKTSSDAVLITRTLRVQKRYDSSGPAIGVGYGGWGGGGWGGYGGWGWGGGTVSEYDVLTLESTLWSQRNGKMVWSATYTLVDPQNANKFAQKLSTTITDQLRAEGMI